MAVIVVVAVIRLVTEAVGVMVPTLVAVKVVAAGKKDPLIATARNIKTNFVEMRGG